MDKFRGPAYHMVHGPIENVDAANAAKKRLFSGYTSFMDKIYALGPMGMIYSLWTLGMLLWHLFRFGNVGAARTDFLAPAITSGIELVVVAVFSGVLIYLSKRVHDSIRDVRRLALYYKKNHGGAEVIHARKFINVVRSRIVVSTDFDLIVPVLPFVIVEFAFVLGGYLGTVDMSYFGAAAETSLLFAAMAAKCFLVLAKAAQRSTTVEANTKRLKSEVLVDNYGGKPGMTLTGSEMVKLSSVHTTTL